MSELKRKFICFDRNMEQRVFRMRETAEQHAAGAVEEYVLAPTQGADARPVAITGVERKAIAKSVFGGINALRWILNIDRKDVRTRQATRLLDDHCTGEGTTNRAHLEHLWKTLNDALSLEDTLECLATRDAAPSGNWPFAEIRNILQTITLLCEESGEPCDGFRFRELILQARKVRAAIAPRGKTE